MDSRSGFPALKWLKNWRSLFPSRERELRTVWRVARDGREGFLAGTAHFFPYRFEKSLEALIRRARFVFFEGPLDPRSMARVVERGSQGGGARALFEALDARTVTAIKRRLGADAGAPDPLPLLFLPGRRKEDPFVSRFENHRPWLAFLEIWSQFLKNRGWKYSVDLEALAIATRLHKEVRYLETIDEQIAALEGVPLERFISYLRQIDQWESYSRSHVQSYLAGDMERMMSATSQFPTRCPSIVDRRDPLMFARMRELWREGTTIAFVGTIHLPGLKRFFAEEGFTIDQIPGGRP